MIPVNLMKIDRKEGESNIVVYSVEISFRFYSFQGAKKVSFTACHSGKL